MRNSLGIERDQLACRIGTDFVDLIIAVREESCASGIFNGGCGRLRGLLSGIRCCDILRHRTGDKRLQKRITPLLFSPSNDVLPFFLNRLFLIF